MRGTMLALRADGTVWAWGYGAFAPAPVRVSGLTKVAATAMGSRHALALKRDGTVWTWGSNVGGQLGDGVELTSGFAPLGPVEVGGLTGATKIAAGSTHSLTMKSDGTLWAWGDNTSGQLGDGQIRGEDWPDSSAPVKVSGLGRVASIAGGDGLSLAVAGDGAVWTWGTNACTREGMPIPGLAPAPVSGLSGVVSVAAAPVTCSWEPLYHLAVRADGSVWEWGVQYDAVPVAGISDAQMVAESWRRNVALKRDGTVWELPIWQFDPYIAAKSLVPVQVAGLTDIVAVAEGGWHSLALKRDGTVWMWGDNLDGSLGDGLTAPVQVTGLTDIVVVAEGGGHSLALKRDGTVWAWGQNIYGQLGVRTFAIRTTPVQVVGPAP